MPTTTLPSVSQISIYQGEHGLARPIATLRLDPAELKERLAITFESERDDLDDFLGAVILSDSGRQFGLIRHLHQPTPGTNILINERRPDLKAALAEALTTLRLDFDDLVWMHPDIDLAGD